MHAVVVPCSAERGQAAQKGQGRGFGEGEVCAGEFGDDGEAALGGVGLVDGKVWVGFGGQTNE